MTLWADNRRLVELGLLRCPLSTKVNTTQRVISKRRSDGAPGKRVGTRVNQRFLRC